MPSGFMFTLLLALTSAGVALADNWERFRGPNGTGVSNDKNVPVRFKATENATQNVRWKIKLPGDGNGSPIIWGDRVFMHVASLDGAERSLLCLEAKTGKELWKRSITASKVKFRPDSSHASATPTTDGELVYVPFWNGKDVVLTAYDFEGNKKWDRNLGEFVSQHGAGASPIVYKDLVFFSIDKDAYREATKKIGPVSNPSTMYAFNKKTGKTVWEAPRVANRACYSAPFILQSPEGASELVVTSTTAMTSYDPESGKVNWEWLWNGITDPLRTINATAHVNGMLINCAGDGDGRRHMVGVALKSGGNQTHAEKVWIDTGKSAYKKTPYVTCLITLGDHIYFSADNGLLACLEAKTGKKVWTEQIPDAKFYASPLMIDGKIYAASESGDVYVFAAETKYNLLATNSLNETIRATPAVANGALYIRTKAHLYCIAGN